jgi:hypothetical protein
MQTIEKEIPFGKYQNYLLTHEDLAGGESLIKLYNGEKLLRSFNFPSYKIYNLSAHLNDIVEYEQWLALPERVRSVSYRDGYAMAAWNGF